MKKRAAAVIAMLMTVVMLFGMSAGAAEMTGETTAEAEVTAAEVFTEEGKPTGETTGTTVETTAETTAETTTGTTGTTVATTADVTENAGETTAEAAPLTGNVVRLSGSDRCVTADKVAENGWSTADNVIIANAMNFADALSGVPLSYALDAPILLSAGDSLRSADVDEINRLGAKNVYILGGKSAVPESVEDQLAAICTVERISGANRYETSAKVARKLAELGSDPDTVFVAAGDNYPDALAGGAAAALLGAPVLFVPKDGTLDPAVSDFISEFDCKTAVALGGTGALPESELDALRAAGIETTERIGGSDRFQTALKINEKYAALFTGDGAALATGLSFPDAMTGGALCAKKQIPLYLLNNTWTVSGLNKAIADRAPTNIYVFGGEKAVSKYAVDCLVSDTPMTTTTTTTTTKTTTKKTTTKTTTTTKAPAGIGTIKITAEYCNVRTGAGTSYAQLGKAYKGESYKLYSRKNASNGVEWFEIDFKGKRGFLCASYATITSGAGSSKDNAYVLTPNRNNKYYIVVYLKSQSIVVYGKDTNGKFNQEINKLKCSSGLDATPTPQGLFKIQRKYRWQLMKGDVYCQYCSAFATNYLFHSVLYEKADPSTLFENSYRNLGGKASHGCVRLCTRDCKWIYDNCPIGTQVRIVNASGPAGKSIPALKSGSKYRGWDPSDPSSRNPYN